MWLDDVRPAPDGWVQVRSVQEAIVLLQTGDVRSASLDHDLGDYSQFGGDGYRVVDWMAENGVWSTGWPRTACGRLTACRFTRLTL